MVNKELFKLTKAGITKDGHTMFDQDIVLALNGWRNHARDMRNKNALLLHKIGKVESDFESLGEFINLIECRNDFDELKPLGVITLILMKIEKLKNTNATKDKVEKKILQQELENLEECSCNACTLCEHRGFLEIRIGKLEDCVNAKEKVQ